MYLQPKKLYVIVDADLSKSQQAVQAAHGVAQYVFDQSCTGQGNWINETLILLKDRNLEKYKDECDSYWREPDLDDKMTAVAFYRRKLQYDLSLL